MPRIGQLGRMEALENIAKAEAKVDEAKTPQEVALAKAELAVARERVTSRPVPTEPTRERV